MKRRIVLLGAPGSGKGTQAEMITREFGLPVTSPGSILRREKELGTPLGIQTAEITRHGSLVPDEIIVTLIAGWLQVNDGRGFVFDGFPRTLPQAESLTRLLDARLARVDVTFWLDVSEKTLRGRIANRLECQSCGLSVSTTMDHLAAPSVCPRCSGHLARRSDDGIEVLTARLAQFTAKTEPLIAFYEKAGILARVDGNRSRDAVFADITRVLREAQP